MKIVILMGSPRPGGHTAKMSQAFAEGAREAGHEVNLVPVCQRHIQGCRGCNYCRTRGNGHCLLNDDMQQVYPLLQEAEMLVVASPIYFYGLSGQLQCAIDRLHAQIGRLPKLKKALLILSSGSPDVYDGAEYMYEKSFIDYMQLEDMGRFHVSEGENLDAMCARLRERGRSL